MARSLSESVDTFQKCDACETVESKDSSLIPCGWSPDMGTDEDDDNDAVVVVTKVSVFATVPPRVIMLLTWLLLILGGPSPNNRSSMDEP